MYIYFYCIYCELLAEGLDISKKQMEFFCDYFASSFLTQCKCEYKLVEKLKSYSN